MVVTVLDGFLDVSFYDISMITDVKRLNSLIGGKTLYLIPGDFRDPKGEARFWVPYKYLSHFIDYLQGLGFSVIYKDCVSS